MTDMTASLAFTNFALAVKFLEKASTKEHRQAVVLPSINLGLIVSS